MAAPAARPAFGSPTPGPQPRPQPQPQPQPEQDPLSDSLEFGPYPEAVPAARMRTRAILAEWDLGELADDAAQVVSELMANAVETHQREHLDTPVRLTLLGGLRTVLIVVGDSSSRTPVPDNPDFDCESGRGLLIVGALAARWDIKPRAGGGKVVRAVLRGKRHAEPTRRTR